MKRTPDLTFDRFWESYPRKVGKLAAQKAYEKARRQASAEQLMAGLELYREHLPDDVQYIPHAATWLNQGRWLDEYEDAVTVSKLAEDRRRAKVMQSAEWKRSCGLAPVDPTWEADDSCPHETKCRTRGICQSLVSLARKHA
jgi:hypothetical protein